MSNRNRKPTRDSKSDQKDPRKGQMNRGPRRASQSKDSRDAYTATKNCGEERKTNGMNDVSWYTKYPELAAAAASLPFPYRPGMSVPLWNFNPQLSEEIPGVMTLEWMPSLGVSTVNTDPASVVAKQIYSAVRKAYSGSLEADPPDFVIYLMALDSIFSYIAWLKRVYRTINAYSPNNYATPDVLLNAMGFSAAQISELRASKVDFWQAINTLVLMSRKFTCPAIMDIFNRHYWMNDNVYTDANSMNSQFYLFNQKAFFQYGPTNTPDNVLASGLDYITVSLSNTTMPNGLVNYLFGIGEGMIAQLVSWDDSYTISGYLARAYDGTPSFIVEEIPYDAVLTPVYNEEVLMQIENSRGLPMFSGNYENYFDGWPTLLGVVSQDPKTNTVISKNEFRLVVTETNDPGLRAMTEMYPCISIRSDAPTAGDVLVATRLATVTSVVSEASDVNYTIRIDSGSEIMLRYGIYNTQTLAATAEPVIINSFEDVTTTDTDLVDLLRAYASLSQFDWHPMVTIIEYDAAGAISKFTRMMDLHNVTTTTIAQLNNIHRVCLYSEFNAFI